MIHTLSFKRVLSATLVLLLLVSVWTVSPSRAAVPTLDTIRVGLFLQLPGKYDSTTPAATFASAGGLSVGVREPGGEKLWFVVPAGRSVRFALDDYKVKVLETKTFASALAAYRHLMTASRTAYLTSVSKGGETHFQVTEGAYKTAAEAQGAVARWNADAALASLAAGYKAELQGPLHLETPPLESRAAAEATAAALGGAGLDAFLAVREAGGTLVYSVMAGAAATGESLAAVQAAAAGVPGGAALKPVDGASRHMLLLKDHSVSGAAGTSHDLYMLPQGEMKAWVAPAGTEPIELAERSNRTYRGSFELSAFNGKLAVINELPFEQYLYSVVAVEMYTSWPIEALKAQAVAARSYALNKGFGFQIAHVVDTTLSQAYYGTSVERPSSTEAVDATRGEVALYDGQVIEAIYSSSGGGMTADASEAWNNSVPYLQPVASPDESSEVSLYNWHRVVLPSGGIGFIREDLVKDTGRTTAAGSRILEAVADATNVRRHPVIQDTVPVAAQVNKGDTLIELEKVVESNPMNWERGPFTAEEMLAAINARAAAKLTGPITSVEVSKRGPSGRATEIAVNGQPVAVGSPDALRAALGVGGSLPSTKFAIEETGKVVVQGAGGVTQTRSDNARPLYVMGKDGKPVSYSGDYLFIADGSGEIRAATKEPAFRFTGQGFGHGVGLSQYGALSLAQQGYDYEYILKYYYKGITIAKE